MTAPAPKDDLREALARCVGAVEMSNGDDLDPGVLADWIPNGTPGLTDLNNLLAVADAIIAKHIAPLLAQRDAAVADLRLAVLNERDAREGERRWAMRCGYILDRTAIEPVPADAGRLAYDTMRTAQGSTLPAPEDRWEELRPEIRQRWAYVEGACRDRARADIIHKDTNHDNPNP